MDISNPSLRNALRGAANLLARDRVPITVRAHGSGARQSNFREQVLRTVFGPTTSAKAGARELANILSRSMDNRSPPVGLFVCAVDHVTTEKRDCYIWLFPQEEAFSFDGGQIQLEVIFSKESQARKSAIFGGKNTRSHFWKGHAHDAGARDGAMTKWWLERFLDSDFAVTKEEGSMVLMRRLKVLSAACSDLEDKKVVADAITSLRRQARTEWSLQGVAQDLLPEHMHEKFMEGIQDEMRHGRFELDKAGLESLSPYRVFRLAGDVMVMAPMSDKKGGASVSDTEGGTSVEVEDGRLIVSGEIEEEDVKHRKPSKKVRASPTSLGGGRRVTARDG